MRYSVLILLLVCSATLSARGSNHLEVMSGVANPAMQEHIIEGQDDSKRHNVEFDLDETNYPEGEKEAPTGKKVELALGLTFLAGVLLLAFWRRNSPRA